MDPFASAEAVSFDCFGTLVAVDRPDDTAGAVAEALAGRGIAIPDDWTAAFTTSHVDVGPGRELPLPTHVAAALESRGVTDFSDAVVREAVCEAFETTVRTREGAVAAVAAAADAGPVGVCSNCSVPGLVEDALDDSRLDLGRFDATVTSVDCGWRKPDRRAFEATADGLDVAVTDLLHVGDDPHTDGAAPSAALTTDRPLVRLAADWRTD